MNTKKNYEIEMMRHNVTAARFLWECRKAAEKHGVYGPEYTVDQLLTDHACDNGSGCSYSNGLPSTRPAFSEIITDEAGEKQTYVSWAEGRVYNQIIEWHDDGNGRGTGYYYELDQDPVEGYEESNARETYAACAVRMRDRAAQLRRQADRRQAELLDGIEYKDRVFAQIETRNIEHLRAEATEFARIADEASRLAQPDPEPVQTGATARETAARTAPEEDRVVESRIIGGTAAASLVYISTGNTKTHIPSVNLLAGSDAHQYDGTIRGADETGIGRGCAGTCNTDCPGCYAKAMTRYEAVYRHYVINTIAARTDPAGFWAAVGAWIDQNTPEYFRIHDSGDFPTFEYFRECMNEIKKHPGTHFCAYTKRAEFVLAYGIDNLPNNLVINCSPWEGHCDPIGDLPQFIYDIDGAGAGLPHCPAIDRNGKRTGITCDKCLHCYKAKRGDRWAVYPH